MVTIGSGVFGWLRVKVCIFPYTLKVVLTTLTLPCECDDASRSAVEKPNKRPVASKFDYRVWGTMLKAYSRLKTNPKTNVKFKEALQVIWGNLPQGPTNKAVKDISK